MSEKIRVELCDGGEWSLLGEADSLQEAESIASGVRTGPTRWVRIRPETQPNPIRKGTLAVTRSDDTPLPLDETQLAEIEARANGPEGYSNKAYADRRILIHEVRRLRSLFTAADAELLEGEADYFYRDTVDTTKDGLTASEQLLALAARIRQAIGEPPIAGEGE